MKFLLSILGVLFFHCSGFTQCFADRHNTSLDSGWRSCETNANPNSLRGDSHWILYDLGQVYEVKESLFWNANHPDHLTEGMREIVIDVSVDGIEWTELANFTLDQALASTTYEGTLGPDLSGNNARYVLITGLSNYGSDCFGLAEIKINVDEALPTNTEDLPDAIAMTLNPNPANIQTKLILDTSFSGNGIVNVYDLNGKTVQTHKVILDSGAEEILIPTAKLIPGMYQVSLITENNVKTLELVVNR